MSEVHKASHETLEAVAASYLARLRKLRTEGTWALFGSIVGVATAPYLAIRGRLFSEDAAIVWLYCFVMPVWLIVNWSQVRWTRNLLRQIVGALALRGAAIVEGGIFGPGYRIAEETQSDARVTADIRDLLR